MDLSLRKHLHYISLVLFAACMITCTSAATFQTETKDVDEFFSARSDKIACPCTNPKLCEPIKDLTRKEVFAFSVRNDEAHWNLFDWTRLTTIVMFGYMNKSLMCLGHSHGVRVVMLGNVDQETFMDESKRQQWIKQQLQLVKSNFLDGINFDFEGAIAAGESDLREGYSDLVRETKAAFKAELPYSQISIDYAWKPNVDIRYYDYAGMAEHADIVFVMAYDEQSWIFGECIAGPNSAVASAKKGLNEYFTNYGGHMTADKVVLGIPWYGYIYPCIKVDGDKCYLKAAQWRGWNCSDAAGKEFDYGYIVHLIKSLSVTVKWNATSQTPYFSFQNSTTKENFQVQFDNPKSLKPKYNLAAEMGLRGVGMWNIDALDYSHTPEGEKIRQEMFGLLPPREDLAEHLDASATKLDPKAKTVPRGMHDKNDNDHHSSMKFQSEQADLGVEDSASLWGSGSPNDQCPCSDPKLCEPIKDTKRKEVYMFSIKNDMNYWEKYDWSKITTVCMYGYVNTTLMCLAHSHNVRAVVLGRVKTVTFITPQLRKIWIQEQLALVKQNFLDGLNFDVEIGISPEQKDLRDALTAIVRETNEAFKKELPFSQVSVDVIHDAYSTACAYDYPGLAAASDFLFIMAYDETGFDRAGPNAGIPETTKGLNHFLQSNITGDKLVLGLPWYGYIYPCENLVGENCIMKPGVKGGQYDYIYIVSLLQKMPDAYRWNATASAPYFTYKNATGQLCQAQYDDPKSLGMKYQLASQMGLRGVGVWTIDFLDYTNTDAGKKQRDAMFGPLPPRSEKNIS